MQGCEKFVQDNLEKFVVDMNVQRKLNYYSCALSNIENMVIAIDNEYFLKYNHHIIEHTKTRIKSMPSLLKKVYDRNLDKYECQIDDSQINRALLDCAQQCNKLDRKMEQIKLNQVFSE